MLQATILGVEEAVALLNQLNAGAKEAGADSITVATSIVYAFGMEFGRYRSGRLARRAGGSFALTGSFQEVAPGLVAALAQAVPQGAAAVRQALTKAATDIQGLAAVRSPRVSGTLAASFTVIPGWR